MGLVKQALGYAFFTLFLFSSPFHARSIRCVEITVPRDLHLATAQDLEYRDGVVSALLGTPRPNPYQIRELGGLHECPCMSSAEREKFENTVVTKAIQFAEQGSHMNYMSYACGGLFPDLVILRRLQKSLSSLNVILIDTIFASILRDASRNSSSKSMNANEILTLELPWIGAESVRSRLSVHLYPKYDVYDLVGNFVGWVSWRSKVKIRIFLFGSIEEYMSHPATSTWLKANFIVACDFPAVIKHSVLSRGPSVCLVHNKTSFKPFSRGEKMPNIVHEAQIAAKVTTARATSSSNAVSECSAGMKISIDARPGSKQNSIVLIDDGAVTVQIAARAVDGQANTELIQYIAEVLGVRRQTLSIASGSLARRKVLIVNPCPLSCSQILKKFTDSME